MPAFGSDLYGIDVFSGDSANFGLIGGPPLIAPVLGDPVIIPTLLQPGTAPPVVPPTPILPGITIITPIEPQTDIALIWNPLTDSADFQLNVSTQELASNQDLITAITISLFCDRLALPTDELPNPFSDDRLGWWADPYLIIDPMVSQRSGSRLWLLTRAKSSNALLPIAKGYVEEALDWLTAKKVASSFTVNTYFIFGNKEMLGIDIVVFRRGKPPLSLQFSWAWQQVAFSA